MTLAQIRLLASPWLYIWMQELEYRWTDCHEIWFGDFH